jgi:hypothetical protein
MSNTHLHLCDVELKQLNLAFPVVENSIEPTSKLAPYTLKFL